MDASTAKSGTLFSIVVPTCQRLADLARCLDSLAPGKQLGTMCLSIAESAPADDYRKVAVSSLPCLQLGSAGLVNYEVVVSDDGREVSAASMIRDRFPWAQWTLGPRRGPAANRNHGTKAGSGEWVAFIDDDCIADSGWLRALASHATAETLDVIEGRTLIPNKRDNPFLHGVENEHGGCYWSCNLAVRRKTFLDIGGFDEEFLQAGGEDMELASRFQVHGLQAHFVPDALVLHPQRAYSVLGFLKRVKLLRWSLLYYQKVGIAPTYGSSIPKIAGTVVRRHFTSLARETWRNLTGKNSGGWRTRLFYGLWGWIVVPYQLPHLLFWEFRFRSQRERAEKNRVAS